MKNMLMPNDIDVLRSALELQADPFIFEDFGVQFSKNIENPLTAEQEHAQNLIQKLDKFSSSPESVLALSPEDVTFLIHALHYLIQQDQEFIRIEKKRKLIKCYELEVRSASVCISRLRRLPAAGDV